MSMNEPSAFIKFLCIVILFLKIPTLLTLGLSLRQRGTTFGGLGGDVASGPTVWSMPGGFTSTGREGYQNVDEERPTTNSKPHAPFSTAPPLVPAGTAYQV
ncbi:hypothetical protein H0H92_007195 [Tricholoma furcatifolium]|nr:hypothetical protein H0H92_007195 [Tricholoma furcatifolium]